MVHCIVGNRLPFRLIENVQFRRLLNLAAGPNTKLHFPNRNAVKDLLMQLAHTSQQNTMDTLPSDSKISIALDCWTSPDQKPFMAVIGYFISADFQFSEVLLGFSPLEGSHSGDRLGSVLLKILEKHNLSHRLLGITTDNVCYKTHSLTVVRTYEIWIILNSTIQAGNNGTMYVYLTDSLVQTLDPDVAHGLQETLDTHDFSKHVMDSGLQAILSTPHHLPCLTHVIQLAVNAFLRELKIDAQNDDVIGIRWNDDDKNLKEKGLIRTLEKVRL